MNTLQYHRWISGSESREKSISDEKTLRAFFVAGPSSLLGVVRFLFFGVSLLGLLLLFLEDLVGEVTDVKEIGISLSLINFFLFFLFLAWRKDEEVKT